MTKAKLKIKEKEVPVQVADVAIVGSGTAALNAAIHLKKSGIENIAMITQKLGGGTSANTGSDKQTYYRVNPMGSSADSVLEMARDLFDGHCMHGDVALVESALSSREFYHLVEMGVPFPQDRYGNYVGFRTDHDAKTRGTSAGPRTSILMFQKLLEEAKRFEIRILDRCHVLELLTQAQDDRQTIVGLLALDKNEDFLVVKADFVVYATGGPGALYADSVYPFSQVGALGIALKAGAKAQNLTESQFGIASKGFRWNLSGSYQQVLPRYISKNADGGDCREFLNDYFPSAEALFNAQFLKGYQWPFDVKKLVDCGSSVIDLLVSQETLKKGRLVYLDYTRNPSYPGYEFSVDRLPATAKDYLQKSKATGNTPIERLKQMNLPAYELFKDNDIDLVERKLEIAICHQHCNGGLVGSVWWESNIENFFPVGECNGTHGLYRPGGSALNSGQVGSLRAAEMIGYRYKKDKSQTVEEFVGSQRPFIAKRLQYAKSLSESKVLLDPVKERQHIQQRMSSVLGIMRNHVEIEKAIADNDAMMESHFKTGLHPDSSLIFFLQNEDLLFTAKAFLESAARLHRTLKGGRGSYLTSEIKVDRPQPEGLEQIGDNKGTAIDDSLNDRVIEFWFDSNLKPKTGWAEVRPLPSESNWFEEVWAEFREDKRFQP